LNNPEQKFLFRKKLYITYYSDPLIPKQHPKAVFISNRTEVSENEERQTSFIYDISDFVKKKGS
jgi:hypothetical protein